MKVWILPIQRWEASERCYYHFPPMLCIVVKWNRDGVILMKDDGGFYSEDLGRIFSHEMYPTVESFMEFMKVFYKSKLKPAPKEKINEQ